MSKQVAIQIERSLIDTADLGSRMSKRPGPPTDASASSFRTC